tara:strand:- start:36 stop:140 length:105 start_codon:yes stop_codon:yes gene_type:complete
MLSQELLHLLFFVEQEVKEARKDIKTIPNTSFFI